MSEYTFKAKAHFGVSNAHADNSFHWKCPFYYCCFFLCRSISSSFFFLSTIPNNTPLWYLFHVFFFSFFFCLPFILLCTRFGCIDWFLIDCCYCPYTNVFPIKHTRLLVISSFLSLSVRSRHCHSIFRTNEHCTLYVSVDVMWKYEIYWHKQQQKDERV